MPFDGGDFESWLEQGLNRALTAQSGPSPLATQASYHAAYLSGGVGMSLGSQVVTALTSKFAVGAATATLVVGGGAAVAGTTATGSLNPTNWGQFISQTVVPNCKDQLATGTHGIGKCVSSIARLHGQEVASAARHHGASDSRVNGKSGDAPGREEATEARKNGAENGQGNGQGSGQGSANEHAESGQSNGQGHAPNR